MLSLDLDLDLYNLRWLYDQDNDASTITMTAGDKFNMPLFIDCGTPHIPKRYKLKANDTVYFAIHEAHQDFMHALVRKTFTNKDLNKYGDVNILLEPEDTKNVLEGQYYYEIKIKLNNGNIETLVKDKKFIITE